MQLTKAPSTTFQHILIYGPPKSGKTVKVGQLAKHFNLHWLDLDNGVQALACPENLDPAYMDNVDVIRLPDTRTFPVAVETILKIFTKVPCKICWDHGVVNCISCVKNPAALWSTVDLNKFTSKDILVIDHAAQLSDSAYNFITKGKGDEYKSDWDDWLRQGNILDRIFSAVQQAPFHVCVITHEMELEMEDKKKKLVPVCGTRNYSRTFAKFFDHVVYSELLNRKHKFSSSTTANIGILTGSRGNIKLEESPDVELDSMFKRALPCASALPSPNSSEAVGSSESVSAAKVILQAMEAKVSST